MFTEKRTVKMLYHLIDDILKKTDPATEADLVAFLKGLKTTRFAKYLTSRNAKNAQTKRKAEEPVENKNKKRKVKARKSNRIGGNTPSRAEFLELLNNIPLGNQDVNKQGYPFDTTIYGTCSKDQGALETLDKFTPSRDKKTGKMGRKTSCDRHLVVSKKKAKAKVEVEVEDEDEEGDNEVEEGDDEVGGGDDEVEEGEDESEEEIETS